MALPDHRALRRAGLRARGDLWLADQTGRDRTERRLPAHLRRPYAGDVVTITYFALTQVESLLVIACALLAFATFSLLCRRVFRR